MAKYEPGEIVTYYFVIKDDGYHKFIKAWTDDKNLAEYYMKFHNCPNFKLKKISRPIEEIKEILNENYHDEIGIVNLYTRSRNKSDKYDMTNITIPGTQTEMTFVSEECNSMNSGNIDYSMLESFMNSLKDEYRDALSVLFLDSVIQKAVYNRTNKINCHIMIDQLLLLFDLFPDEFG